MQFSYLAVPLSLIALAAALPSPSIEEITGEVNHFVDGLENVKITGLSKRQGCNLGDCAKAAAPQVVSCSKAFLTKSDIWDDAACAAGIIALSTNTPAQCSPCLSQLKDKIPF